MDIIMKAGDFPGFCILGLVSILVLLYEGRLMLRKDYIMRMIEEFAQIVAKILRLRMESNFDEVGRTVHGGYRKFFGLDATMVEMLSDEDLIALISGSEGTDPEKCSVLAGLLKLDAETYEAQQGFPGAYTKYMKSLNIFLRIFPIAPADRREEYSRVIGELLFSLREYMLPDATKHLLFSYYESIGAYAGAEDMLFELLESTDYDSSLLHKGISFYERLLQLDEADLIRGNLSGEEVRESLGELQARSRR